MSAAPLDPFTFDPVQHAPDGSARLVYGELRPISGHGGPMIGALRVEPDGATFGRRRFSGPPVWSADGRRVAVPEWTWRHCVDGVDRFDGWTLAVFDLESRRERSSPWPHDWPDTPRVLQELARHSGAWRGLGQRQEPLQRAATLRARMRFWLVYTAAMVVLSAVAAPVLLWRRVRWFLAQRSVSRR